MNNGQSDPDNPLDKTSKVDYDNFLLELGSNGFIDREELAKQFKLDVESYTNEEGLFVVQGRKILRKPYDASFSTRKVNEQITAVPKGFSKIFYAEGATHVTYFNPAESIPAGCYCTVDVCGGVGPDGHVNNCSYPNALSLCLTLKGFVECLYSTNKSYRMKLLDSNIPEIKQMVEYFIATAEQNVEDLEEVDEAIMNEIYIQSAIETNEEYKFLAKAGGGGSDLSQYLTTIRYHTVHNISGLTKGKINYFHGATVLQYYSSVNGESKRSSIRIYDNAKITVIPCNWDPSKRYEKMITELYERINETGMEITPTDAFISVANGSFRLIPKEADKGINLKTFYEVFHPTDEFGNPADSNDFMSTHRFTTESGSEKIRRFAKEGKNKYAYSITEEGGAKRKGKLSMTFVKYENDRPTSYKITTQIYSTGIVQMIFAYREEAKSVERKVLNYAGTGEIFDQVNYQTGIIKSYFELVRKFLLVSVNRMYSIKLDIFETKEVAKKSANIFNTVPGVMPYGKKVNMYAGYIVDFFDDTNENWDSNYGWSVDDDERGVIVAVEKAKQRPNVYMVITGKPRLEKVVDKPYLDRIKFKTLTDAPLVEIDEEFDEEGGEGENEEEGGGHNRAYLIEEYVRGKPKHWVISGTPYPYTARSLRIHKQSVNDKKVYAKDTQVCEKTVDGIDARPVPYSFYGSCPGGLSQYIGRVGVQSRKDNKFYPTCTKVTEKNRKQVENEIVDFILNGMSEEQMEMGNISTEIEYEYGVPIADKYAGTFKPGTIDIGNTITFWDESIQGWSEGVVFEYNKSHGLGNDENYTSFILQRDSNEECGCLVEKKGSQEKRDCSQCSVHVEVRGEQFHPKHRENRNFKGLNNLIPNEKDRKEFLIGCAKKLGLVKPAITLRKEDNAVQTRVLKSIETIEGTEGIKQRPFEPFIEGNILGLTKHAYEAVLIPTDSIRCLLFIMNDKHQYIIDSHDRVRAVVVDFAGNVSNTIIDGFITEKNDYYPFDLLFHNGAKVSDDYLYSNRFNEDMGRLIQLQTLVSTFSVSSFPNAITVKKPLGNYGKRFVFKQSVQIYPFIGPIDSEETLIQFVKKYREPTNDILFVPQAGTSRPMIWKHYIPNAPIVVQLLQRAEGRDSWYVGLIENLPDGKAKAWKLLRTPISLPTGQDFRKYDFIKVRLNMMANGMINHNDPYINPVKVDKSESKTFEETKIDINLITKSVKEDVFQNANKWEFSRIEKVFVPDESSREPLKEKIYVYAGKM